MDGVALHWFRNCLRLHDNQALTKATESNSYLIPLYVLDPDLLDPYLTGANQMGFLLDTLRCLDEDLRGLGTTLFVVKGDPVEVVEKFMKLFHVDTLTFQRDTDPHNRAVDEQVLKMAASHGVRICATWGDTLYEMDYLLSFCHGQPPSTQDAFIELLATVGPPLSPVDKPDNIPPPPPLPLIHPGDEPNLIPSTTRTSLEPPLDELDKVSHQPLQNNNCSEKLHGDCTAVSTKPAAFASMLPPFPVKNPLPENQEMHTKPISAPRSSSTILPPSSPSSISTSPNIMSKAILSPTEPPQAIPHPIISPKLAQSPTRKLISNSSSTPTASPKSIPSPVVSPILSRPLTPINHVLPSQTPSPKIIPPPALITQAISPPPILTRRVPHPDLLKESLVSPSILTQKMPVHSLLTEKLTTPALLTQSLACPCISNDSILSQSQPHNASVLDTVISPILSTTSPFTYPSTPTSSTLTSQSHITIPSTTSRTTMGSPSSTVPETTVSPANFISVLTILTKCTPTSSTCPQTTSNVPQTHSPAPLSSTVPIFPTTLCPGHSSVSREDYKTLGTLKDVPVLSDLVGYGYCVEDYTTPFKAGEKEALRLMDQYFSQRYRLKFNCNTNDKNSAGKWYDPPDTSQALSPHEEIKLSPYLARGSLSVRLLYQRFQKRLRSPGVAAKQLFSIICRCAQMSSASLESRLLAREYAYLIGYSYPKLEQLIGEPTCVCMRINWVVGEPATELLRKWEFGETGFPAVDACMNQLRREGWLHNSCRHMVAAFLTGSGLMVYWELGRSVFEKYLLDYDWSINSYEWHWISCTAFFHRHFKSINPATFLKKCDPSGSFVRKYVPVLGLFPKEFIYEPWLAPLSVQEECGCIVGKDYPMPIIDHRVASKRNMEQIRRISEDFLDLN